MKSKLLGQHFSISGPKVVFRLSDRDQLESFAILILVCHCQSVFFCSRLQVLVLFYLYFKP